MFSQVISYNFKIWGTLYKYQNKQRKKSNQLEVPGIEPGTFRMRSGHSTTELHPHRIRPSAI